MDQIRYGIIGTGMMGVEHIENLAAVDGVVVTAISDPNGSSREAGVAAAGDEAESFEHHSELIESGRCDAVVVASPNFTHAGILDDLFDTDLHVLVEKPMCITTEECKVVVERVKNRAALFWVGLEYRYMPPAARLVAEAHAGTVGDIRMVAIREHRFPFLVKVDDWNRHSRNTGGTLVEKCCHFFDLMNLIVQDRPVQVMASGGQDVNHLDEVYNGETSDILDNAFVIVDYPDGVRGLLDLSMFAEATHNQEEISVVGTAGKVEALIPENVVRIGRRGQHVIGDVEHHPVSDDRIRIEGYHHGSSYLEHVDFAAAIRTGGRAAVTAEDGLWSVAIGEAAHLSIEQNRPIRLDELI